MHATQAGALIPHLPSIDVQWDAQKKASFWSVTSAGKTAAFRARDPLFGTGGGVRFNCTTRASVKCYFEVEIGGNVSSNNGASLGYSFVKTPYDGGSTTNPWSGPDGWMVSRGGAVHHNGLSNDMLSLSLEPTVPAFILMVALDMVLGRAWLGRGGSWSTTIPGGGVPSDPEAGTNPHVTGLVGPLTFAIVAPSVVSDTSDDGYLATIRAGGGDFNFSPPRGFIALANAAVGEA